MKVSLQQRRWNCCLSVLPTERMATIPEEGGDGDYDGSDTSAGSLKDFIVSDTSSNDPDSGSVDSDDSEDLDIMETVDSTTSEDSDDGVDQRFLARRGRTARSRYLGSNIRMVIHSSDEEQG
jgi:hypothetical protein